MKQPSNASARPPHEVWTLVPASLGVFVTALDTLVVTTALPVLRVDLGASLSDLEWTVNAYNLSFACLLLTGAALGGVWRYGRRMTVYHLALAVQDEPRSRAFYERYFGVDARPPRRCSDRVGG